MSRFSRRPVAAAVVAVAVAAVAGGCGGGGGPSGDPAAAARIAETEQAAARIRAEAARAAAPRPRDDRGPVVLRGRLAGIDGRPIDLARLRGQVVLVVNTASRCGFTEQYAGLEALWRTRRAAGLVVVGVPSADFRQELGSNGAVARFCRVRYGVSFPLAARTRVVGPRAHPLFAALAARPAPAGGSPRWNFTKYLIDREGRLAARLAPHVAADDPLTARALDRLLAE